MTGRIVGIALAGALAVPLCSAQDEGTPSTLGSELKYLGAQIAQLQHSLPNISCRETVVSQEMRGGKAHHRVDATATLEVKRSPFGEMNESFTLSTLNGEPFEGGKFRLPAYVEGGFDKAINYFSIKGQACYRYTFTPGRIEFETDPAKTDPDQCNQGVKGFALLDAEGNVTHVQRTISADPKHTDRNDDRLVPFAAIDFRPVQLNGRIFRLASHMYTEVQHGGTTASFEANYENCHLFGATMRILPATEVEVPQPQL